MTEENKKRNQLYERRDGWHALSRRLIPERRRKQWKYFEKEMCVEVRFIDFDIESCVIMIERIDGISWEEWTIIIFFANFLSRNRVSGFGFKKVLDISYLWSFHLSLKFRDSWGSLLGISSKKRKNGKGLVEENLNLLLTIKSQFQSQCWAADWEL